MKKAFALALFLALFCGSFAFAAERGTAEYERLKEYKRAQREEREAQKANPEAGARKGKSFWQKEGERSGLGGTGSRIRGIFKDLNPMPFLKEQQEKYNARKASAATK